MLAQNDAVVWGECQGSGKDPYRVECDLSEPAFKCTCPSRKFPCKHGIGLLLIFAQKPESFKTAEPPAWVAEWLEKRSATAEKKIAKAEAAEAPADPETEAKRAAAREKRIAGREDNVRAGAAELELWLRDIVRQGLGAVKQQPVSYWENTARRMVDAQAPGLARRVRECGSTASSGDGWAPRLLAQMGLLFLLTQAATRLESLPAALAEDARAALGFTTREEDVLAGPVVRDAWQVQGEVIEEEEKLRVRRVWLRGRDTGRTALLLSFAAGGRAFDLSAALGTEFVGELAFFPSGAPLRAVLKKREANHEIRSALGFPSVAAGLSAAAGALALNPWLDQFPFSLSAALPVYEGGRWWAADSDGERLPLATRFAKGWELMAFSGGIPVTIFGEWDGRELSPLSAFAGDARFLNLRPAITT